MRRISNEHLTVEILSPGGRHPCLGARYCHGGYIWQVHDGDGRPLCSGPQYPEDPPTSFNGQGLPEVFRPVDKRNNDLLTQHEDGEGLIIGIGRVSGGLTPQTVTVDKRVSWSIDAEPASITFRCSDAVGPWSYELERRISLSDATLVSANVLHNTAPEPLELEWYAHPFFPHTASGRTSCHFHHPLGMDDHRAYRLDDGHLHMLADAVWDQSGHFHWLHTDPEQRLDVTIDHPVCSAAHLTGDFPIHCMPVWANCHTLSIEPYLRRTIPPGGTTDWALRYTFGA